MCSAAMDSSASLSCKACGKVQPDDKPLARCVRCKLVAYCSKACQTQDWPQHKSNCGPPPELAEVIRTKRQAAAGDPKRVLLVSIDDYSWLRDMYTSFIANMKSKCDFVEAKQAADAVQKINEGPHAVIVFEPAMMEKKKRSKHQAINDALVSFVRAGGTVIFGCGCSSFARPPDVEWYFPSIWQLPWQTGNYARYDFQLGQGREKIFGKKLPTAYNVKALQLKDVDAGDVIYHEHGEAHGLLAQMHRAGMTDFDLHGPNPAANGGPVIWRKHGDGHIAWLGDVNNEKETQEITMRMCGL